jgi:hypothetical protein
MITAETVPLPSLLEKVQRASDTGNRQDAVVRRS